MLFSVSLTWSIFKWIHPCASLRVWGCVERSVTQLACSFVDSGNPQDNRVQIIPIHNSVTVLSHQGVSPTTELVQPNSVHHVQASWSPIAMIRAWLSSLDTYTSVPSDWMLDAKFVGCMAWPLFIFILFRHSPWSDQYNVNGGGNWGTEIGTKRRESTNYRQVIVLAYLLPIKKLFIGL